MKIFVISILILFARCQTLSDEELEILLQTTTGPEMKDVSFYEAKIEEVLAEIDTLETNYQNFEYNQKKN